MSLWPDRLFDMNLHSNTVIGPAPHFAKEVVNGKILRWAHDIDTDQLIFIGELEPERNGLRCRCVCTGCGSPLEAVNAGKKPGTYAQMPHFRHTRGGVSGRERCLILASRAAELRLLLQDGLIVLPSRAVSQSWRGFRSEHPGTAVRPSETCRIAAYDFVDRTEAILTLEDGRKLVVHLTATNSQSGLSSVDGFDARATIFIDVKDSSLAGSSPDELRARMKGVGLQRSLCWLNHWDDRELEQEAMSKARANAQEVFDCLPDGVSEDDLKAVPPHLISETVLHFTVKQILADSEKLKVPEYEIEEMLGGKSFKARPKILGSSQWLTLSNPCIEHRIGRTIPDISVEAMSEYGKRVGPMSIEVTVTHGFNAERMERLRQENRLTLEIDLSGYGRTLTVAELKTIVVDELKGKKWLLYPGEEACRKKLKEAVVTWYAERTAKQISVAATRLQQQPTFPEDHISAQVKRHREQAEDPWTLPVKSTLATNLESLRFEFDQLRNIHRMSVKETGGNALVDGIFSLHFANGHGVYAGLNPIEVALKLRYCGIAQIYHPLILKVIKRYHTIKICNYYQRKALKEWEHSTWTGVVRDPRKWQTPIPVIFFFASNFPELEYHADFLLKKLYGNGIYSDSSFKRRSF